MLMGHPIPNTGGGDKTSELAGKSRVEIIWSYLKGRKVYGR